MKDGIIKFIQEAEALIELLSFLKTGNEAQANLKESVELAKEFLADHT